MAMTLRDHARLAVTVFVWVVMAMVVLAVVLWLVVLFSTAARAQHAEVRPDWMRDDGWSFCRLMYNERANPAESFFEDHVQSYGYGWSGVGWITDYPKADRNLMHRVADLTTIRIQVRTPRNTPARSKPGDQERLGEPKHWVVQPAFESAALSMCPFVMANDVGKVEFTETEIGQLRDYLLKGGFLWVDDFWGPEEWDVWVHEIRRVLPDVDSYPIEDLPASHRIFTTPYVVRPWDHQVPNLNFWSGSGRTSEYGIQSRDVNIRGISDEHGRLMILMTHNTDIGDTWEREAESLEYFEEFAGFGYSFGINVLLHALTG